MDKGDDLLLRPGSRESVALVVGVMMFVGVSSGMLKINEIFNPLYLLEVPASNMRRNMVWSVFHVKN